MTIIMVEVMERVITEGICTWALGPLVPCVYINIRQIWSYNWHLLRISRGYTDVKINFKSIDMMVHSIEVEKTGCCRVMRL
jgi:hypothetical protein